MVLNPYTCTCTCILSCVYKVFVYLFFFVEIFYSIAILGYQHSLVCGIDQKKETERGREGGGRERERERF